MITIEKPHPCACGERASTSSGDYGVTVYCDGACSHEIIGDTLNEAIIMWNAAMKALRDAKNEA